MKLPLLNGDLNSPIVVIGDPPSYADKDYGTYLCGTSLTSVDQVFRSCGFPSENVLYVAIGENPCPKKGGYGVQEIRAIADEYILPLLRMYPRRHIIACGTGAAIALGLLEQKAGVNALRMQPHEIDLGDGEKVPVTVTSSLYFLLKDPESVADTERDLRFAALRLSGKNNDLPKIRIVDVETVEDVYDLLLKVSSTDHKLCAYDVETSGLDREIVRLFTSAFYFGERDSDGTPVVYFYAEYDRLYCLYSEEDQLEMQAAWRDFFDTAQKNGVGFIAHNAKYDDMVIRKTYDLPHFRVFRDTRLEKWQHNSVTWNSLKDNVSTYLGYIRYDGEIDDIVAEIAARRTKGKQLSHPDDYRTLAFLGREPETVLMKTKTKQCWPHDPNNSPLSTKECAYGLIPLQTLRLYNAYDALFTWDLHHLFAPLIREAGLEQSNEFRHLISNILFEAMERGVLVDVKLNRKYAEDCQTIVDRTDAEIRKRLADMGFDAEFVAQFNPESSAQLAKVLFGEPVMLPFPDAEYIRTVQNDLPDPGVLPWMWRDRNTGDLRFSERKFDEIYDEILYAAYGQNFNNYRQYRDSFDVDRAVAQMQKDWKEIIGTKVPMVDVPVYAAGAVMPTVMTKTNVPSTARTVLEGIYHETQNEWLRVLLMHRRASKLKSTFLDGIYNNLDKDNVLRIGYNEIGAQGGRVSSYGPNGQNFPKAVRGQIIPRPGYKFITWDLSQAEVRILAAFSQDEALLRDCNAGRDLHRVFAARIFGKPEEEITDNERQTSKTIVFGIIYGLGIENLAKALGCSPEAAEELIELFYTTYPGVREWRRRTLLKAAEPPYHTQTMIGTRRSSLGMQSVDNRTRSKAERVACNQPIQGTGGELTFYYINYQLETLFLVMDMAYELQTSPETVVRTDFYEMYEELIEDLSKDPRLKEYLDMDRILVARLALTVHDSATFEVMDELAETFAAIAQWSFEVPCPWGRLRDVRIEADVTIESHWDGEPNLVKAIDPKFFDGKSKFPWHMIAPEMLEKEDVAELKEVIDEDQ